MLVMDVVIPEPIPSPISVLHPSLPELKNIPLKLGDCAAAIAGNFKDNTELESIARVPLALISGEATVEDSTVLPSKSKVTMPPKPLQLMSLMTAFSVELVEAKVMLWAAPTAV
tara:strand:- start:178 stop:519 length:342 start_codon:yes stop_codon:yes gene_type:complete